MAGLVTLVGTDQVVAEQVQVADGIEDLVPDALVLVAQTLLVHYLFAVDDYGIVQAPAQDQVLLAQEIEVLHEAEGPGPAHLLDERRGGKINLRAAVPVLEHRVVELYGKTHLEPVIRFERRPFVSVLHAQFPFYPEKTLLFILFPHSRGLDHEHERTGAAVHDRHLLGAHVNIGIVDTESGQRGEQVLHRGNTGAVADQRRGQPGAAHVGHLRRDLRRGVMVDTAEDDTRVGRCRAYGDVGFLAGMQPYPLRPDRVFQCALSNHLFVNQSACLLRNAGISR